MRFREASTLVAYRLRWRVLLPAVFFPSPLLIAVFRSSALEGWSLSSAITFALLVTIWGGIIAWLIAPIRNWWAFKVVLLAIAFLLFDQLISGLDLPGAADPWRLLIVGGAAALIFIAAIRIRAPTAEDIRLTRNVSERSSGGPWSMWTFVLASLPWIVVAALVLKALFGTQSS